jgi:hypothetical protein
MRQLNPRRLEDWCTVLCNYYPTLNLLRLCRFFARYILLFVFLVACHREHFLIIDELPLRILQLRTDYEEQESFGTGVICSACFPIFSKCIQKVMKLRQYGSINRVQVIIITIKAYKCRNKRLELLEVAIGLLMMELSTTRTPCYVSVDPSTLAQLIQ